MLSQMNQEILTISSLKPSLLLSKEIELIFDHHKQEYIKDCRFPRFPSSIHDSKNRLLNAKKLTSSALLSPGVKLKLNLNYSKLFNKNLIRKMYQALKYNPYLRSLALRIEGAYSNRVLEKLFINLQNLRSLEKFDYRNENFMGANFDWMCIISRSLRYLSLKKLNYCSLFVEQNYVEELEKTIRRMMSLESLAIDFSGIINKITNSIILITQDLKAKRSLREFSLCLNNGESNPNPKLASLTFEHFENLKSLSLANDDFYNFGASLPNIVKGLLSMKSLENLKLEFKCKNEVTEEAILNLATTISSMKQLRTLDFDCNLSFGKNSDTFCQFIECLSNLIQLWNLKLKFYWIKLDEKSYLSLAKSLKELKALKKFELYLKNIQNLDPCGIDKIFKSISLNENLRCLSLHFHQLNDLQNGVLGPYFSEKNAIEVLDLAFNSSKLAFNQEYFESLFKGIKTVSSFKKLKLDFSQNPNFSDASLEELSKTIEVFKKLEVFKLDCSFRNQVTGESLNSIMDALGDNLDLVSLELRFNMNYQKAEVSAFNLAEKIQNFKKLETLYLQFNNLPIFSTKNCSKYPALDNKQNKAIDKRLFEEFIKNVIKLKNLHEVIFYLDNYCDYSEENDDIKDTMSSNLPFLSHFAVSQS